MLFKQRSRHRVRPSQARRQRASRSPSIESLETRVLLHHSPGHGGGPGGGGGGDGGGEVEVGDLGFGWAFHAGNETSNERGRAVATDNDGNAYLVTSIHTTVEPFGTPPYSTRDIVLAKFDNDGNFLWSSHITGEGSNFATDVISDGTHVYVTGKISLDADFGSGISLTSGEFVASEFVAKYDTDGNALWAQRFATNMNQTMKLAVGPDGIYASGSFAEIAEFGEIKLESPSYVDNDGTLRYRASAFAAKLDSGTGAFEWVTQFDAESSQSSALGHGIAVNDSHVYVLYNSDLKIHLARLEEGSGTIDEGWTRTLEGSGGGRTGTALAVDSQGDFLITGAFSGTTDFDPGPGTVLRTSPSSPLNTFILRLSNAGAFQWVGTLDSRDFNTPRNIAVDGLDNVYVVGRFNNRIDLDPTTSGKTNVRSVGYGSGYVTKIDSNNNFLWGAIIGGDGDKNSNYINNIFGVAIHDASGDLFLSGGFSGKADFDPTGNKHEITGSANRQDIFLTKWTQPSSGTSTTSLSASSHELGLTSAKDHDDDEAHEPTNPGRLRGPLDRLAPSGLVVVPLIFQDHPDLEPLAVDLIRSGRGHRRS